MATQRPTAEVLDQLREGIATLTTSDKWAQWLRAQRRFHNYSFGNSLLILLQRPEATRVAGYHTWRKLGRQVRKGEKGIVILAPVAPRIRVEDENGEEQVLAGPAQAFRTAYVFDVAQTEGPDLPSVVDRIEGEDPNRVFLDLMKTAASVGYSVEFADFADERNGDCTFEKQRIRVRQGLSPAQSVKTLAHELGHALLHGEGFSGGRELAELEAESVAYVVCQSVDLDTSAYSFGYVATWAGGGEQARKAITESAQRIQNAARLILGDDATDYNAEAAA